VTETRAELQERRDLRLRDLADLDARVRAGELTDAEAARMRRHDEWAALAAIAALDELDDRDRRQAATDGGADQLPRRRPGTPRRAATVIVGAALATVVGVALTGTITDRPVGGYVTGNEAVAGNDLPSARTDVPTDALEEVVATNPDVAEMRMVLADRLFDEGRHGDASEHYLAVLDHEPHPGALTRLAWIALGDGELDLAGQLLASALQVEPGYAEALWVQANLALTDGDDRRARELLEQLATDPTLDDASQREVADALAEIETRDEAGS
jgi:tetratricopeptide (TPR) repeat protein